MKTKRYVVGVLMSWVLVGLMALPVSAGPITFNLDVEFSGATAPAGSSPWVTATFEDVVGGGVQLTINALNLTGTEFISEFYFNLDPAKNAALFLPGVPGGGTQTDWNSISAGSNAFKADGDGFFDFVVDFPPPGDRFTAGETFIVNWGAGTGLTTADFNFASVDGPVGKTGFHAAAHVHGIGADGAYSGWIGAGPAPVPDGGATLVLLGLGLMGLSAWRGRSA